MGLPAGLSSCPKGQDNSGVAAEEPSGVHQRWELVSGECRPQNPGQKTVGCFGGHGVPKASQQPVEREEDPLWRQRQRRSVRRQQSGRSVSRLASRHRAPILSDMIINENLKLLQINYLALKVDVLFNFPSGSVLVTELKARPSKCMIYYLILLRMRNVSDRDCREYQNTHFMFNNSPPKIVPFVR